MKGFKSSKDVIGAAILLLSAAGFFYTLYLSLWNILWAPVWIVVLHFIFKSLTPRTPGVANKSQSVSFCSHLLTVGGKLKTCIVCVKHDEITIHPQGITVPMGNITDILFEDKSTDEISLAGFCLDFIDATEGPSQITFVNQGWGPLRKTKADMAIIQDAHSRWIAGSNREELVVVDVGEFQKQQMDSAAHVVAHSV